MAAGQAGLVIDLLSALESLAQHRLLDRLIRGRVWIGLVAFALIGIVTLQLGLLKLNGGIGRALEHEALLQTENAALSIENSELAAGTHVQDTAAKLGMASVPTGGLRFLSAGGPGEAAKAATALASAAHEAAQAREVSASEAEASSSETSESESSAEGAGEGSGEAGSEAGSEASASASGGSEETAGSGEAGAVSESSPSESAAGQSIESTTASPEAESSGGSAASSTGE